MRKGPSIFLLWFCVQNYLAIGRCADQFSFWLSTETIKEDPQIQRNGSLILSALILPLCISNRIFQPFSATLQPRDDLQLSLKSRIIMFAYNVPFQWVQFPVMTLFQQRMNQLVASISPLGKCFPKKYPYYNIYFPGGCKVESI